MATRVHESGPVDASVERVWDILRPLDFSFLPTVATSVVEDRDSPARVGSVRRVVFKDGTVQLLKLTELHDANHTLTWDVIMSEPAVSYTSAVHTIRLRRVTASKQTLVELISDYSSDASMEVIEDSKFKKLEFVKALRHAVSGRPGPASLQDFVRRAAEAEALIRVLSQRMDSLEVSRSGASHSHSSADSKGNDGVLVQVTAIAKPGKMAELEKTANEYVRNVIQPKSKDIQMHSGVVPIDDSRFIINLVFKDSGSLLSFLKSAENGAFHSKVLHHDRVAPDSQKMTVFGNVPPAVKEALKPMHVVFLPNNGFSR